MWNLKQIVITLVVIVFRFNVVLCAGFIGDVCHHNVKGASGKCTLIMECAAAIEDLKKFITPQNCGFQGQIPIVCCVGINAPSPKPPSSTKPPTSPKPTKPAKSSKPGEKSLKKCQEYKKHAFITEFSPVLLFKPVTQNRNDCPFDAVQLIIGGEKAKEKEFPHMALIGFDNAGRTEWDCGGTLISENYVMTAAHCLFSRNYGEPTAVRLGDLNVGDTSDDGNVQQMGIARMIAHPEYLYPSRYNDIALLELNKPADLGPYVRPACLYTKRQVNTTKAIATGWGFTEDGGSKSNDLLKVVLEFFTAQRCNKTYASDTSSLQTGISDDTQICAGSWTEEKDTCQGDSGGPFQIYSETYCMYDIIGVTSYGKSCGFQTIPAVYTRVSAYLDWIENIVWP